MLSFLYPPGIKHVNGKCLKMMFYRMFNIFNCDCDVWWHQRRRISSYCSYCCRVRSTGMTPNSSRHAPSHCAFLGLLQHWTNVGRRIDSWFDCANSWKLPGYLVWFTKCWEISTLQFSTLSCGWLNTKNLLQNCGHPVSNHLSEASLSYEVTKNIHYVISIHRFEKPWETPRFGTHWSWLSFWGVAPRFFANEERLKTRWPASRVKVHHPRYGASTNGDTLKWIVYEGNPQSKMDDN